VQILVGTRDFVFPKLSGLAVGPTQPSVRQIQGIKWPGREINFSHPTSAKVRMSGTVPLLTLDALIA